MASQKRVELELTLAADAPAELETDSQRLRQVLRNLLSNALKFTTHGKVSLKIFTRAGSGDIAFCRSRTAASAFRRTSRKSFSSRSVRPTARPIAASGARGWGLSISRELAATARRAYRIAQRAGAEAARSLWSCRELLPAQEEKPGPRSCHRRRRARRCGLREHRPVERALRARLQTIANGARVLLIVEDDASFARDDCHARVGPAVPMCDRDHG